MDNLVFSPILSSSQYYQSIEIRESVFLVRELSSVVIHNVNVHITVEKLEYIFKFALFKPIIVKYYHCVLYAVMRVYHTGLMMGIA